MARGWEVPPRAVVGGRLSTVTNTRANPNERTNVDDSLSNPSLFHCVLQRWRDCRLVGMSSPAPVPLVGRTKAAEGG